MDKIAMSEYRPKFKGCSFENYKITNNRQMEIVETLKKYALNFNTTRPSLILLGNTGTGKGHLVHAIGRVIQEPYYLNLIKSYDMMDKIKSTWDRNSDKTEMDVIKDFHRSPLLCIDDVGLGFDSVPEKLLFYKVIDYRSDYLRPTIITANCSVADLKQRLGEQVVRRVTNNGGILLVFDWETYDEGGVI